MPQKLLGGYCRAVLVDGGTLKSSSWLQAPMSIDRLAKGGCQVWGYSVEGFLVLRVESLQLLRLLPWV